MADSASSIGGVAASGVTSIGGTALSGVSSIGSISPPAQGGGGGGIDSYTTLMLHGDGSNDGTIFTDSSSNNLSATKANVVTKTDNKMFGTASIYLKTPDATSYLTYSSNTAFNVGSGDFTIDFWVRFTNGQRVPYTPLFLIKGTTWNVYCDYYTNRFRFNTLGDYQNNYTYSVDTTTWYHVACVRSGDTFKLAINGVFGGTSDARTGTVSNGTTQTCWVGSYDADINTTLYGNIDEFRVSKGIARWTNDFTPPTSAYSA